MLYQDMKRYQIHRYDNRKEELARHALLFPQMTLLSDLHHVKTCKNLLPEQR